MTQCRVVVVGAGITGLVAARELAKNPRFEVLCLEATDHIGGQLHTARIDGAPVDVGAEAIHLGAPHVAALVRELGLDESVVGATPGSSVLLTRKGLRPLPAGVGPTGPTQIWPVLKSGILTPLGILRAGLEPLMARRRFTEDTSVGDFTAHRFGHEVTDTFVDPLLGNLHGGDVHRLGLQATAPQLVAKATSGASMLTDTLLPKPVQRLLRRRTGEQAPTPAPRPGAASGQRPPLPMFASWPGGLNTLTDALAEQTRATIRTGARVSGLERGEGEWIVVLDDGERIPADHVLLTGPSRPMAALLQAHCPAAAALYEQVPSVSVATVVLGYEPAEVQANPVLRDHNGLLLPSKRVRTFKAATNLGRKWPGLKPEHHLLRASVGRDGSSLVDDLGDEEMIARVAHELGDLTGLTATPAFSTVHRWPHAMPQLLPGHPQRVVEARTALAAVGGLHIAGCSVDGLGIGSTVKSGLQAASSIIQNSNQKDHQ